MSDHLTDQELGACLVILYAEGGARSEKLKAHDALLAHIRALRADRDAAREEVGEFSKALIATTERALLAEADRDALIEAGREFLYLIDLLLIDTTHHDEKAIADFRDVLARVGLPDGKAEA